MRHAATHALSAGAILGVLSFSPTMAEILVQSADDDDDIRIIVDREVPGGHITREYYDGSEIRIDDDGTNGHVLRMVIDDGQTVSTCVRLEADGGENPLACVSDADGKTTDSRYSELSNLSSEIELEIREALRDVEREMAELELHMACNHEHIEWAREAAAGIAEMATQIQETVMTSLAESGISMESDGHGNETVWIRNDEIGEPSLRVVSSADDRDLVFMYFNGFENEYHYVIEDGQASGQEDLTLIHAYDVSSVEIIEDRRGGGDMDTEVDRRGDPHLTIRTDDPGHIRVIPLNRSQFEG